MPSLKKIFQAFKSLILESFNYSTEKEEWKELGVGGCVPSFPMNTITLRTQGGPVRLSTCQTLCSLKARKYPWGADTRELISNHFTCSASFQSPVRSSPDFSHCPKKICIKIKSQHTSGSAPVSHTCEELFYIEIRQGSPEKQNKYIYICILTHMYVYMYTYIQNVYIYLYICIHIYFKFY